MLWIETGIAPPKAEATEKASKVGANILHMPALVAEDLHRDFSLDFLDTVFIGSPRAAKIALKKLSAFKASNSLGKILAVGEGTAKELEKLGLHCDAYGDSSGAQSFLEDIQKGKFAQLTLPKKMAWISAEETAADLTEIAKNLGIEIIHIPVYRTIPNPQATEIAKQVTHPCKWILRSGKGVKALCKFFEKEDTFEAIGKSAEAAIKALD